MNLTAVAIGGPRNGVRITAPFTWNGVVHKPTKSDSKKPPSRYPGRYQWRGNSWVWVEEGDSTQ